MSTTARPGTPLPPISSMALPEPRPAWKPRELPLDKALEKMWKNLEKALTEHGARHKGDLKPFLSSERITKAFHLPSKCPLTFTHEIIEIQGERDSMEDRHVFVEKEEGILACVLDGHGGHKVAEFAKEKLEKRFFTILQEKEGNVHQAFELIIDEIQNALDVKVVGESGSTAVISFIDKRTHLVYTATLGDSEANIYRQVEGGLTSIPLSCIRDWGSAKDAQRVANYFERQQIAESWTKDPNPKDLRFSDSFVSINVSRALGGFRFRNDKDPSKPILIHKPKITVFQVEPNDTLIVASDGLKDELSEERIIDVVAKYKNPGKELLKDPKSEKDISFGDNTTIICIKIEPKKVNEIFLTVS